MMAPTSRGESSRQMSAIVSRPDDPELALEHFAVTEAGAHSDDDNVEVDEGHSLGQQQKPQRQPLLPGAPRPSQRQQPRTVPIRHGRFSVCGFVVLAVLTILALSFLSLNFQAASEPSPLPEHPESNKNHDSVAAGPTHDGESTTESAMPESPRLRSMDEYIIDPAWDVKAPPTKREFRWTIADADLNPDGVFRPMMLINNQFPGPLVQCNDGDTIIVHVENRAVNATSIHFHGLFQNGTNHMDGTVGVTQCAIAPGTNFTYQFDVRGQSGTYWYHAHQSAQASDGLLGPVVVHNRNEKNGEGESKNQNGDEAALDYATDRVVMVQDHYHNLTSELLMHYLQPDMENDEPVPDNALVNGHGVRNCTEFSGWKCDDSLVVTPVFDLAAGQRHRLRIINVGAFAEFQIQFDEHSFHVIEVDGTDVHPEPFHRLNILPAQRYSIVLETNVTTADSFWMRSRMVSHCFTRRNSRLQTELKSIIRYVHGNEDDHGQRDSRRHHGRHSSDEAVPEPESKEWPEAIDVVCRDLNTSALRPVDAQQPPPADDYVLIRANFEIGNWALSRGFFNDSSWRLNATHPSLHRFLDSAAADSSDDTHTNATSLDDPVGVNERLFERRNELVLQTTGIRTVDIAINNFDDGAHPFHLHGHKFFVLTPGASRRGYPPSKEGLASYLEEHGSMDNPLRRDTVTVEGYSWIIIRVVLDNPGLWTLHCHNTWHAESGMVMQLLVRSEEVSRWQVDPDMRAMCAKDGVSKGMRPDDSIWFGHID